jgi:predicted nucleotidyltransferase
MTATVAKDARGNPVDVGPIARLLQRIVEEFVPVEIRLFGSRARGEYGPTSDWDLFIVVPDDLPALSDLFAGYRLKRELRVRADILLCTVSEFAEDRNTPNTLAYEAAHFGVLIYER